jgi:hypothetical protein
VDNSPSPYAEDLGKKENKSGKHRPNPKAEPRRYQAKGIQYRIVTRLAINDCQCPVIQFPKRLTEAEVIEAEEELKALQRHAFAIVDLKMETGMPTTR